ncbi:MAG: S8 family serine peptidase [Saprospiraceae bacterium]
MRKIILSLLFVLANTFVFSQSQILVNEIWEKNFGIPLTYTSGNSTLDINGDFITVGHSTISTGIPKLLIRKQNSSGSLLWEDTFNLVANTKSYGTLVTTDNNSNIYVAGLYTSTDAPGNYDYLLAKYSTDGILLWNKIIVGSGQGDDIPVAITTNDIGDVYITGVSEGINSEKDFFTVKVNQNTGAEIWTRRYDYALKDDIPINMSFDNNGNLIVIGGSAVTDLKWDVALIKYDTDGNLIETKRLSNQLLEFKIPSNVTKDQEGNILITGIRSTDGINFKIRTVKLSDTLGISWIQDFDSGALVDSVCAIACDPFGNAIVTGWTTNEKGGNEFVTIKYNKADGEILWVQKRTANPSTSLAKSMTLCIDEQSNVFIAGEVYHETQSYISVMQYDADGNIKWEKRLRGEVGTRNRPLSLLVNDQGELFVTGIKRKQTEASYSTYKLQIYDRELLPVFSNDQASHINKEIIVRFKPNVIDQAFIDNPNFRYTRFGDVIADETCFDAMDEKLETSGTLEDWQLIKVHRSLSTRDSMATTHLGETLSVPDFYNTFVLVVPKDYQRIIGEFALADSLQSDDLRCCVRSATPNLMFTVDCEPNDNLYSTQGHLHPNATYDKGHINMEPAWCIHTGRDHIKIAIIDSGVEWSHEDFGGTAGFEASVIEDGYDYTSNTPIENTPENDPFNHGTKVASVAAAIRNNGIGVAGMAGGDDNGNGVRLIVAKTVDNLGFGNLAQMLAAYADAALLYDVNVINHSGGISPTSSYWTPDNLILFREQLHFANRMGITIVASRGNKGAIGNAARYPGTAQDEWILCVGGTDKVGLYNQQCSGGLGIDIAAPSRWELTRTIQADGTNEYGGISFTSGAAPHGAGLAALMQSYYSSTEPNLSLVQEDIEYIIQVTADDVDFSPASVGYDDPTGHGKINAGAAMELIERSHCNILHFGTASDPHTRNIQMLKNDIPLELTEPFTTATGLIFEAGMYKADVYKVQVRVEHSLPMGMNTIEHFWERHSGSTVFKYHDTSTDENTLQPLEFATFVGSPTLGVAILKGYVYHLKDNNCSDLGWIPAAPETANLSYSLLACTMTSTNDIIDEGNDLTVYPNPTQSNLTIEFDHSDLENVECVITDIQGRIIRSKVFLSDVGTNKIQIQCEDFPRGLYFCKIIIRNQTISRKFIKQ